MGRRRGYSRKKSSFNAGHVLILLILGAGFYYLVLPTVLAENQITINVSREFNNEMSVLENGQLVEAYIIDVFLTVEYTGTISDITVDGVLEVYFDNALKEVHEFELLNTIFSGEPTNILSFRIEDDAIHGWGQGVFGMHELRLYVPFGTELQVSFTDGFSESRTYNSAMGYIVIETQQDGGIVTSSISVEAGEEYQPEPPTPDSIVRNGDFEDSTKSPWSLYLKINVATLTLTTDSYEGNQAGLLQVTSYTAPQSEGGYVCMQNSLVDAVAGETYTVSFTYKSTANFNAFILRYDGSDTQSYDMLACTSSATWKTVSFDVTMPSTLSSTRLPWIDFRFYSLATATFDNVLATPHSTPTPTPTPPPTSDGDFKYALWCRYDDLSPTFLDRIQQGKIDVLVVNSASVQSGNTLQYSFNRDQWLSFKSQVLSVNPNMEFFADIYAWQTPADHSSSSQNQILINNIVEFVNYFDGDFNAIMDDTEYYIGTPQNHYDYFSQCASVVEPLIRYYPWVYYGATSYVDSDKCSVGLYDAHTYYEDFWKNALDKVRDDSYSGYGKSGFQIWLMAEHYLDYPTISQQLVFMDEQIAVNGVNYYSKMESIGMWWYNTLTDEDWNSWINWVSYSQTPNGINLIPIPDGWYEETQEITFLDYSMVHTVGSPSIRIEPHTSADNNYARECDSKWFAVEGGDELYTSIWIYMSDSSMGSESTEWYGGKFGCDFYGHGTISETTRQQYGLESTSVWGILDAYPHSGTEHVADTVRWGTKTWTQKSFADMGLTHVPTTYYDGSPLNRMWIRVATNTWEFLPLVAPTEISSMVCHISVGPVEDAGMAWFADPVLIINPASSPNPTESINMWSGTGTDYCLFYSDAPISVWTQYTFVRDGITYNGHIDTINYWKEYGLFKAYMGFTLNPTDDNLSHYDKIKFGELLTLCDARGVQVVAYNHPDWNSQTASGDGYMCSPEFRQGVLQFVQDWKGDDRIAAFVIYQEPVGTQENGQGTNPIAWHSSLNTLPKNAVAYFAQLIKDCHAIDPDRVIVFPMMGLSYWSSANQIADMEPTGIFNEPNVVFDIVHPYLHVMPSWWGDRDGDGDVDYDDIYQMHYVTHFENDIIPYWKAKVSSDKLLCGETFMFLGYTSDDGTPIVVEDQKTFMLAMLNSLVRHGVSFNYLCQLGFPPHNIAEYEQVARCDYHTEALIESNFDTNWWM